MIVFNVVGKPLREQKYVKNAVIIMREIGERFVKGIKNRGSIPHRDKSKYHRPSIETIVVEDDDLGRITPDFQTFQEERDWKDWEPNSYGY